MCRDVMTTARLNTPQLLVIGFLVFAWVSLVVILAIAPGIYTSSLRLPSGTDSTAELLLVVALSGLILLMIVGVLRRWRWTFWLLLIAFLSGILRVPASIAQYVGWIPPAGPTWYLLFQGLIGLVQFAIGLAMLIAFRRHGTWGLAPSSSRR
jgi:hypothetical protein